MEEKDIKIGVIYITTNLINNKKYIGQDSNNNKYYFGGGKLLKKALKKYGTKNFKKEILEICNKEDLNTREIFWIKHFNAAQDPMFYNLGLGGSITVSKYKKIECYDLDGNYVKTYNSVYDAEKDLNKNNIASTIYDCAIGKAKSVMNFQWKYPDDNKKILKYKRYTNKKEIFKTIYRYNDKGILIDIWRSVNHIINNINIKRHTVNQNLRLKQWTKIENKFYFFSLVDISPGSYQRNQNRNSNIINIIDVNNNLIYSGTAKELSIKYKITIQVIRSNARLNRFSKKKNIGFCKFYYGGKKY